MDQLIASNNPIIEVMADQTRRFNTSYWARLHPIKIVPSPVSDLPRDTTAN